MVLKKKEPGSETVNEEINSERIFLISHFILLISFTHFNIERFEL